MPWRVPWRVQRGEPQAAYLEDLLVFHVTVYGRDLAEPQAHHHRLRGELLQHGLGLCVHQDRTGVLVYQSSDGSDVVYVGVGYEDLTYLEVQLLDREGDADGLVAGIDDGARACLLIPDYVAVLLEGSDGERLEDHRARPITNSTRRRAGTPVAPFGV